MITENFIVKEFFDKYNNLLIKGNPLFNERIDPVFGFVIVATTVAVIGKIYIDTKTEREAVKAWIENKLPDDGIFIDCTKFELKIKDIFEIKYEKNIQLKQAGEDGSPIPNGEEKTETIEYTEPEEEIRIEYEILKEEKPAPWELIPAS